MCGIVGYIGNRKCKDLIIDSLKKLEYRGYDSAGIAVLNHNGFDIKRSVGKIKGLEQAVLQGFSDGCTGIGHTRWATHGRPSEENAHPHRAGKIALIHNGIIENYLELKKELKKKGIEFSSETDTEVIAHVINMEYEKIKDFEKAVVEGIKKLRGSFALAILCEDEPDKIMGVRNSSPLILGAGSDENLLASDLPAILSVTRKVVILEDLEYAILFKDRFVIKKFNGEEIKPEIKEISWNPVMAEKAGYKHFMLKEIYEQPRAIIDTVRGRLLEEKGDIYFEDIKLSKDDIKNFKSVKIVACGTSLHAALVGKFIIEEMSKIPVEVDYASEFRYRKPLVDSHTLLVLISQSGETADTLAALREGKKNGCRILSVCNVVDSSIARESDWVIYTHAGPEIGVASTKAFTTQLSVIYLLALFLGRKKGMITEKEMKYYLQELVELPEKVEKCLKVDRKIQAISKDIFNFRDFLYLGRGISYPVALEGALKLKEISYIHAEGYPSGEMKHGPIALIDEDVPVVIIAPRDEVFEKICSNMEEVKARGGKVILLTDEKDENIEQKADYVLYLPKVDRYLTPILYTVPLQLLAYHIADIKGTDIDQPRNLAKSVTVE